MTVLTKTVTLSPGQSQQVSFQVIPTEAGLYQVLVNGLTGSFTAIEESVFDPWQYDTDNSCYIEVGEVVKAANDHLAGLITKEQADQVTALWENHTRNPACGAPPPDYLEMERDELYAYLISKSISRDWWSLPESERRELASRIINWWSVPFGTIITVGEGDLDCVGNIHTIKQVGHNPCSYNADIRCCLFSGNLQGIACPSNKYYLLRNEWHCYRVNDFGLPTFSSVTLAQWNETRQNWDWAHSIVAIQVGENKLDFYSWLFFQYTATDIKPGDYQMPSPGEVIIFPETNLRWTI